MCATITPDFLTQVVSAQTRIRERLELNARARTKAGRIHDDPPPYPCVNPPSGDGVYRLARFWQEYDMGTASIGGVKSYPPWGSIGLKGEIISGGQYIHLRWNHDASPAPSSYEFTYPYQDIRICCDGDMPSDSVVAVISRQEIPQYDPPGPVEMIEVLIVRPRYHLSTESHYPDLNGMVEHGGYQLIGFSIADQCYGQAGESESRNFTIKTVEGKQWGRLQHPITLTMCDSMTGTWLTGGYVKYVADGENPPWQEQVRIQYSSSNPAISAVEETLHVARGAWFQTTVTPDTVLHGDTAVVTVIAKDKDGNNAWLPDTTHISLSLDSTRLGSFMDESGQKHASPYGGCMYGDVRQGRVRFVADGERVLVVTRSTVRSACSDLFGTADLWLNGFKMVVQTGRDTLQPLGDADNMGPRGARVIDFSRADTTRVELTVTDLRDRPVQGKIAALKTSAQPTSGGHDHEDSTLTTHPRPRGRFMQANGDTLSTYSGATNASGKISITYLSSGFGGIDSIIGYLSGRRDTVRRGIILRVPGLQQLGAGSHYVLIGAYPGVPSQHRTNHYGKSTLIQKLLALSDSVYADSGISIRINDMSLVLGGPFDIKNQWNAPHENHREGISADIDDKLSDMSTVLSEQYLGMLVQDWLKGHVLAEGLKVNGVMVINHYHLTFR
jgi:hypothetical protein